MECEVLGNCEYLTKHIHRSPAVGKVSPSFIAVRFSVTVYDSISLVSDSTQPALSRQAPSGDRRYFLRHAMSCLPGDNSPVLSKKKHDKCQAFLVVRIFVNKFIIKET